MADNLHFVANPAIGLCPSCGSVRGQLLTGEGEQASAIAESACPSPFCPEAYRKGELLPGVDISYLYRGRALLFFPYDENATGGGGESVSGLIRAVPFEHVHDRVARRQGLVVAENILWPDDRKRFGELFDHHIHHENAPHVTPLNDGWDSKHGLPVL
jgi:hypothetical protein